MRVIFLWSSMEFNSINQIFIIMKLLEIFNQVLNESLVGQKSILSHITLAKDNKVGLMDIIQSHDISGLVNYDWDRFVFGVSSDDIIDIPIKDLKIQYTDMENVDGFDMKKYFKGVSLDELPSIEVSLKKGKFYIEDGHHRYGYARQMGIKTIKAELQIKDNPFNYLGLYIDDIIAIKKGLPQ